jgi:hypothetical protein
MNDDDVDEARKDTQQRHVQDIYRDAQPEREKHINSINIDVMNMMMTI